MPTGSRPRSAATIYRWCPLIVSLGGQVRIDLEDYQYAREGQSSNAQLAERAAGVIRAMGHEVATPEESREMLEI